MKETFELISIEENAEFISDDRKYVGIRWGRLVVSIYELKIPYKKNLISIRNELGNSNLGKFHIELKVFTLPIFEITNRSHFWRLFNRKSNILKITCEDVLFRDFLQQLLLETQLEQISRDNLFEPKIYNVYKKGVMNLICDYHLEFENKEGVLRPLIQFYKCLIDYSLANPSFKKI